ncbi:MAG: DNA alkylation repair protein [Candidatus Hodarchaeota archaeon]
MKNTPSISSKSVIIKRTQKFWNEERLWQAGSTNQTFNKISGFLAKEYGLIPQKERIGKGRVYITKNIVEGCFNLLEEKSSIDFIDYCTEIFNYAESKDDNYLRNFALILLAKSSTLSIEALEKGLKHIKTNYANHLNWEMREISAYTIREGLRVFPEVTIAILKEWLNNNPNANVRRLVAESLRPMADIKWLRDPEKNDSILDILIKLKADESEYVRKSVGNNIKDLSKYMPVKTLDFVEDLIKKANIPINDNLASKTKSALGEDNYYLVWTIKHGLRWLRERNPEYHERIEKILGRNYILYFDEKRNRMAKPR